MNEWKDLVGHWRPVLVRLATQAGATDRAHDLNHLDRVWATARQLLSSHPQTDPLVVMAACYLHDLVNLPKDHPERAQASRLSAQQAETALSKLGFPQDKLRGVVHAIEAHSFSAAISPETIEAKIVQDADRLDALGAVGLARMFHIGGQLGRALAHATDPLAQDRPLDDVHYTLDHIENKLLQLPASMQTAEGRALAQSRVQLLIRFRDQFAQEWLGTT